MFGSSQNCLAVGKALIKQLCCRNRGGWGWGVIQSPKGAKLKNTIVKLKAKI